MELNQLQQLINQVNDLLNDKHLDRLSWHETLHATLQEINEFDKKYFPDAE